jgi:predicted enzyme related to lactoylglutathione lyase
MKVSAIFVRSGDVAKQAAFYRSVLGFPAPTRADAEHTGFQLENTYFGFEDDNQWSGDPVAIWFGVDDVDGMYRRFLDAGAFPHVAPDSDVSPGERLAAVRDPEGNVIGLIADAA